MRPIKFKISYDTAISVPLAFIDRYMANCTPVYALIYIYGLRHIMAGGEELSTQAIGEVFHILETDVLNAWKYWEAQGLIKMDTIDEDTQIEFLPFPEADAGDAEQKQKAPIAPPIFSVSVRPQYTTEELSFYKGQSRDIAQLFKHGEQTLAKMLTYNDLNILFGFYDWLRLPIDVILFMLNYCAGNGHRDIRYLEKVAIDWAEQNIYTVEEAENYTQNFDKNYRSIMKALGQASNFPSPTQIRYMKKWVSEMEMPIELILKACDKSFVNTGKAKLNYIDGIITKWKDKGVTTLDEAAASDADWYEAEKAAAESDKKQVSAPLVKKRNRFANFKPRERNYEEIEQMEMEYLMNSVKG